MSKDINLAALGKFAEGVNTGNFALFDEVVASGCIDHDPAPGQVPGPEGYRMFFTQMRTAFPDLSVSPDALVADDESIAFAYTLTGTQNGLLMGIPPTGRKIKIRGLQFSKFKDGKMVERWGSSDELGPAHSAGGWPTRFRLTVTSTRPEPNARAVGEEHRRAGLERFPSADSGDAPRIRGTSPLSRKQEAFPLAREYSPRIPCSESRMRLGSAVLETWNQHRRKLGESHPQISSKMSPSPNDLSTFVDRTLKE